MEKILDIFHTMASELLIDEQKKPVVDYIPSDELFERIDLTLEEEALEEDVFLKKLNHLVQSSTRTATNGFFNQLYGGRNPKAVLGELLSVILNNSMYTYKAAGVQVGVEKSVLQKVCEIINWDKKLAGGTFPSGGSLSNLMSLIAARDAFHPSAKFEGVQQKMIVYTSEDSHYSIPKNAAFAGIGRENVRFVPTDDFGKMNVRQLEIEIEKDKAKGNAPFMINATAGTTVLGAYDDVEAISKISKKHQLWLHIDAVYGGGVIFSKKYKRLLKGVENADSFSFNAHKMLGTPLTCSVFVVKDKKQLYQSFSSEADYLFQTEEEDFNPGKTSLQCGRRNDALKLWSLWKSVGTKGLEELVNHQFELADFARDYVRNHPDYTLHSFEDSISVCFNYKGIPAKILTSKLYENAQILVSYGATKSEDFIRLVTINGQNTKEDILYFFKKIEQFVAENPSLLQELKQETTPKPQ